MDNMDNPENKKIIKISNSKLSGVKNTIIIGDNNKISGFDCIIKGDNNTVRGFRHTVTGLNNTVYGKNCVVNNKVYSKNCSIINGKDTEEVREIDYGNEKVSEDTTHHILDVFKNSGFQLTSTPKLSGVTVFNEQDDEENYDEEKMNKKKMMKKMMENMMKNETL